VALPATSPGTAPAPAQEASPDKAAAAAKPANSGNDGLRAQALLEGKPSEDKAQPTEGGRFIVQVGAYADAAKAREVRLKMERVGIKTYTHVANTKDGQLTRVRVGPFASRSEAEQAAAKVKKLDLPASVLTL
jgi:DedD protein